MYELSGDFVDTRGKFVEGDSRHGELRVLGRKGHVEINDFKSDEVWMSKIKGLLGE